MASGTSYSVLPPRTTRSSLPAVTTVAARTLKCEMDGSVPAPSAASRARKICARRAASDTSASDSEVRRQDAADGGLDAARAAKMAIRNREPEAMVRIIMATFLCLCRGGKARQKQAEEFVWVDFKGDFCVGFEFGLRRIGGGKASFERRRAPNGAVGIAEGLPCGEVASGFNFHKKILEGDDGRVDELRNGERIVHCETSCMAGLA